MVKFIPMASAPSRILANYIEALQAASKKAKLTNQLEDSLQQINSVVKLLVSRHPTCASLCISEPAFQEISKPSGTVLEKLASIFAQRLLPLYTTFPILGISYSVAVLVFIHEEKITNNPNLNISGAKETWEDVLTSLLSGILVCSRI